MKKRAIAVILVIILALSLMPAALAAEGMDNFKKVNDYPEGHFTDVPPRVWYQQYVIEAYEYDLVKGYPDCTFLPARGLTIAEAIALATRIHSIYYTGGYRFVQECHGTRHTSTMRWRTG